MDESALLHQLRDRIAGGERREDHPPATMSAIAEAERVLGLRLPQFYVRLLTEVANGGFGPGYGILGIPPDGFADQDAGGTVVDGYLRGRAGGDPAWRTPRGLLYLCNWGCGAFSYVDALSPAATVVSDETFADRVEYIETAPSLAGWLSDWLSGVDVEASMREVVGQREGVNPFTGKPHSFPISRPRGRRLDFAERK